jgi:hypothetical protein
MNGLHDFMESEALEACSQKSTIEASPVPVQYIIHTRGFL